MLEVGCGRGDLARAIAESGHEVVAIDPDAPAGLYGELGGATIEQEERALVDAGVIQAMGFRYVGERRLTQSA